MPGRKRLRLRVGSSNGTAAEIHVTDSSQRNLACSFWETGHPQSHYANPAWNAAVQNCGSVLFVLPVTGPAAQSIHLNPPRLASVVDLMDGELRYEVEQIALGTSRHSLRGRRGQSSRGLWRIRGSLHDGR